VKEKAGEKIAHLSQTERENLEQEIALSSLRIAILRSKLGLNINFDPDTSLSFEGDSGPYLLYTHARLASLLEKGGEGIKQNNVPVSNIERTLVHYNEVLTRTVEDLSPQTLVTYLFDLAQEVNAWYAHEQMITDDKDKTAHNMALVKEAKRTLAHGLYVLGMKAPERM
jgi:arginyl-tRNA synthetase